MKKNLNQNLINLIEYYSLVNANLILSNKPLKRTSSSQNMSFSGSKSEKLEKLKNSIKTIKNCELKKNAKNLVFGDGNINSNIMLIGEGPGAYEDAEGKPFVGRAGKLLNKMLAAINIKRENVYITNVVPWRPPNNRTPTEDEILECLPILQKQIEIINPKLIFLLGKTAAKAILTTPLQLSKLRKVWHTYKTINMNKNVNVLVSYHPAFLLRSPEFKKEAWIDLKILEKKIINEN